MESLISLDENEDEPSVKAIYHHVGFDIHLPQEYSEGVLLIPESHSAEDDVSVVAPLLGVLWQMRKPTRPRRKSLIDKVFGKK